MLLPGNRLVCFWLSLVQQDLTLDLLMLLCEKPFIKYVLGHACTSLYFQESDEEVGPNVLHVMCKFSAVILSRWFKRPDKVILHVYIVCILATSVLTNKHCRTIRQSENKMQMILHKC